MTRKINAREPDIPAELRDHLNALVREYKRIRKKEDALRRRVESGTAPYRNAMREIIVGIQDRLERLEKKRNDISDEFLATWASEFPDLPRVKLPFAYVLKRRTLKVEVLNTQEVIDALDRLDRLDLVNEAVNEKGVKELVRKGKLETLSEDVLSVVRKTRIQVVIREGEE